MAGEAQSINFAVGTATIMLGAPADLRNFTPATHSIGLVKDVKIMAEASYIKLTQGVRNSVVHSIKTGEPVSMGAAIYEYNAKNWTYALGFAGYDVALTAASTNVTTALAANPAGEDTVEVANVAGFNIGDYVMLQVGTDDRVYPRRISNKTTGSPTTLVFDADFVNIAIPLGATVRKCAIVPIGRKSEQPFLAAKIVGSMADNVEVCIEIPKLRVTKGFDLTFQTSDYANMPFEFDVYDLVPADPQYARSRDEFDGAPAFLYTIN